MRRVHGAGHGEIIPDEVIPQKVSNEVIIHGMECNMTPNIAMADADFEGDLICGDSVVWLSGNFEDPNLLQSVQENEEPETTSVEMCSESAEICGSNSFKIKVSNEQLRKLECEDLRETYMDYLKKLITNTLETSWDNSHLAYLLMMADANNTGNNALGMVNLGSPDNPIVLSKTDRDQNADILEALYTDLHLVLGEQQGECETSSDNALIMPNLVASHSLRVFSDLNVCCADDNVKVTGQLPKTILGFDPYKSTKKILSTIHNGRRIYYIIAVDKYANGFVSDVYGFKWWEGRYDWFLVGTEVHGSYVLKPEHVAVAVVTFE